MTLLFLPFDFRLSIFWSELYPSLSNKGTFFFSIIDDLSGYSLFESSLIVSTFIFWVLFKDYGLCSIVLLSCSGLKSESTFYCSLRKLFLLLIGLASILIEFLDFSFWVLYLSSGGNASFLLALMLWPWKGWLMLELRDLLWLLLETTLLASISILLLLFTDTSSFI